jgi:hypothetical protein
MTTLSYLDLPSNVVLFFGDPTRKVDDAMCEFCSRHGIPASVTADAINLAQAHRERGNTTGAAIEFGKNHVRLWLRIQPERQA